MNRESAGIRAAFLGYEVLWRAFTPFLRLNHCLRDGFLQRLGMEVPPPSALWIQAASVGEAYLAREIVKRLYPPASPLGVLLTTNTRQGLDIHRQTARLPSLSSRNIRPAVAYFPFDRPTIMKKLVCRIRPTVAVFLETEIWPGLLRELKHSGTRVLIINGRISRRSLDRYLTWPSFWRQAAPQQVLAVSEADAARFRRLFTTSSVAVMPNIKFDRLDQSTTAADGKNDRPGFLTSLQSPFVILGSVRQEEEASVGEIIAMIRSGNSHAVIGLFPRHLHRIDAWQKRLKLKSLGIPWVLRSRIHGSREGRVPGGTVVLWDIIGRAGLISAAYERAQAVFVGGSLAPLGGQNFIEALICGIIPSSSGLHGRISDGSALNPCSRAGLARIGADWRAVADHLIRRSEPSVAMPRWPVEVRRSMARAYFSNRKGGADDACRLGHIRLPGGSLSGLCPWSKGRGKTGERHLHGRGLITRRSRWRRANILAPGSV